MTKKHPYDQLIDRLKQKGIVFEKGLTEAELVSIGTLGGFTFPPDLADFLMRGVPIGTRYYGKIHINDRFPNWHDSPYDILAVSQDYLLDGILFDVRRNNLWKRSWGERPSSLLDAIKIVTWEVTKAPKLIPLCGHRYLPASPCLAGNPVLSIHQTDIIYYGANLEDYWRNEFLRSITERDRPRKPDAYRRIEFWSTFSWPYAEW